MNNDKHCELTAELEDLLDQRLTLRRKLATDADRTAYEKLSSRIVALKKQLKTI